MVRYSGQFTRQAVFLLLLCGVTLTIGTADAHAQGVGFQAGVSIDPEQVYVGSHFETRALIDRLHFRPNIEGGFGDDRKLATLNIDFIYKFPIEGTSWTLFQGSGPVIVFERFGGEIDVHAGLSAIFGVAHANGFFTELKVGGYNAPNLKFGVGFTVR